MSSIVRQDQNFAFFPHNEYLNYNKTTKITKNNGKNQ